MLWSGSSICQKITATWLLIFILTPSCGNSTESSTETDPSVDQPSTIPSVKENPDSSGSSNNVENTSEAKTNQAVPKANDLDPREFQPEGTWLANKGLKDLKIDSAKVIANDDGRDHNFPECEYPIPAPGHAPMNTVRIDGEIGEWPINSIVSIDKSNDVGNLTDLDLRSVFWGADNNSYYLAIELYSNWKTNNDELAFLNINFNSLNMPQDQDSIPTASLQTGFAVIDNSLYLLEGEVFVPVKRGSMPNEYDYELSISKNIVELRINRKHIINPDKYPFAVDIFTSTSDRQIDRLGPHIVGLIDDYACLVPTPNQDNNLNSYKLLVMRREPKVDQNVAELSYRAMVNALQYVTYLTKDSISDWDTNNIISISQMNTAGLYIPAIGHFIIDQPKNFTQETGLPITHFFIAAHELLHSLNVSDYKLPSEWLREGHSNWFTLKILESYFGKGVFQKYLVFENNSFLREETIFASGNHSIADENWNEQPHTPLFYYRKSAALFSLLLSEVNYDDFRENLLHRPFSMQKFNDTETFLRAFKELESYPGSLDDEIKSSWLNNSSNNGRFSKTQLQDPDFDGLFNFQETKLGTNTTNPDSDQDGLSDTFEWSIGFDPMTSNEYDFIALDNLMQDWIKNHPDKIISSLEHLGDSEYCDERSNITRFSVVKHADEIVFAIELGQQPSESDIEQLQIVIFINTPNFNPQIIVPFGSSYYLVKNEDNSVLRSNQFIAPFRTKTLEILLKLKWLNWGETPPQGTKFRIVTYDGINQCDYTDDLTPVSL